MRNIIQIDPFEIIGILVKTTNKNGQSMIDMGQLWNRFYSENILSTIPDRLSDDIYSIYTDYKSDYREDYTAIIGCKVKSLDHIPNGLIGRQIHGGNYLRYISKGQIPDAVIKTWQEIWDHNKELRRKYTADYEVYRDRFLHREIPEVDIYVATE
jgi:predicted transcriptional regulator YdeE